MGIIAVGGVPVESRDRAESRVLAFPLPARYCSAGAVQWLRNTPCDFRAGVLCRRYPFERGIGYYGHARLTVA